jgi:hypothetical protein
MREEDARAYVAKYEAAEAVKIAELRAMTLQQKWERFMAALALADELGLELKPEDKTEIYERWARLKRGR